MLCEINKRKKLVKELDKYAVCKKILDCDKNKEITALMSKLVTLSSSEKIDKEKNHNDLNSHNKLTYDPKEGGESIEKNGKFLKYIYIMLIKQNLLNKYLFLYF